MTNEIPENVMPSNTDLPPEPGEVGDPDLGVAIDSDTLDPSDAEVFPTEVNEHDEEL